MSWADLLVRWVFEYWSSHSGGEDSTRALLGLPGPTRPQLLGGAAADNTSATSEREVAIAVLSQLERRAEVLDKTALALALCSFIPMLS